MTTTSLRSGAFSNWIDLLLHRAQVRPDDPALTYLEAGVEAARLTNGELERRARAIGAALQQTMRAGDRALLFYPPGLEFVAAFFGCLFASVIPVPAYPPRRNQKLVRIRSMVGDAEPGAVLLSAAVAQVLKTLEHEPGLSSVPLLQTDAIEGGLGDVWRRPDAKGEDVAFLQYTSGSTSTPRGVMVTHANLLHNSECIRRAFELTTRSVSVTWLPSYHDMGLIDGILQPIYTGFPGYVMSPAAFLQRPLDWLKAISRYRATHSGGPNFGYALCVSRTTVEQRTGLDLSCWEGAYNGAEPICASTLDAFARAFEPHGFQARSFYPCYGLAEATLLVTGGRISEEPVVVHANPERLAQNVLVSTALGEGRPLVGCGHAADGTRVVVVDPGSGTICADGRVGEIWVCGASVAKGYWRRPEVTEEFFRARLEPGGETFLRTGDLGTLLDGELLVTGRRKDVLIILGRNHYPQDIERTVEESHKALRQGCGAAFTDVDGDAERLIVVQEIERTSLRTTNVEDVAAAVRRAIAEEHDLQLYALVLLPPGRIPKTSSGKIQRSATREAFLAGRLEEFGRSVLCASAPPTAAAITRDALLALAPAPVLRRQQVLEYLRGLVTAVLGVPAAGWSALMSPVQLGMESLAATEFQHRLEADFGLVVPGVEFLKATSFDALASRVCELLPLVAPATVAPEAPEGDRRMSRGQQALWFIQQTSPSSAAYNVSVATRIRSPLDRDAFIDALRRLTSRHAALHTAFPTVGGRPVQRVLPHVEPDLAFVDATAWSPAELREYLGDASHAPFDLGTAPLLRARVYQITNAEHVVLVTAHHVVVDYWSIVVLLDELWSIYAARRAGKEPSHPLPSRALADHADWQAAFLGGRGGEESGAYWQAQLAGAPMLSAPYPDRPRGAAKTYRGAARVSRLETHQVKRVKEFAAAHEVTPFVLLLATFHVLLHRYTGQEDILVGSSVAGRDRREFAGTVGYLVNQLVLRARPSAGLRFDAFLAQVRETVLAALAHQDFPFAALVERLHVARASGHTPLFQTMLVFERPQRLDAIADLASGVPGTLVELHGTPLETVMLEQRTSQFDLTLRIVDGRDCWTMYWEYDTDLYQPDTIDRMRAHLDVVLEAAMADPGRQIGDLPLLTPEEQDVMVDHWNNTAAGYAEDACVHELFEAHAAMAPTAIAVQNRRTCLTYAELNERANRLAHHVRELGVRPEVRVAVFAHTSVDLLVALLGVLKAGGAYIPIDPSCPPRRLRHILEDAGAHVVVTQQDLASRLPGGTWRVLAIDAEWDEIAKNGGGDLGRLADASNLAYVIYTSGSTGEPKGAMVPHRGLVNYLSWCTRAYDAAGGTGAPVNTPIGFDATITSLFAPLVSRNRVLLLPEEDGLAALTDTLSRERDLTLVKLTPGHLDLLRDTVRDVGGATRAFVVGGEALSAASLDDWQMRAPGTRFFNEYGPTETVVGCCVHEVIPGEATPDGNVSIGRPIANTQLYVLDGRLQPVPIGAPGELYIGGAGVARGYLNRPDLTAARFVPDPFGRAAARLYRTGDLVRSLSDGKLEFLGRLDDQVKIRGFRIELGEIEAVLRQHPLVADAAVAVHGQERASRRLVAYVVWRRGEQAATDDVRRFLAERVPQYMQPATYVSLGQLPLTLNGKVDWKALPAPGISQRNLEGGFVLPNDEIETLIANVWREVLAVDRVGREDSFFDLGGHSLLAVEAHHRLQERLGHPFQLIDLLQNPTARSLAQHLRGASAPDLGPIESRAEKQRQAATLRRERARKDPGTPASHRASSQTAEAQRRATEAAVSPEPACEGKGGDES